MALNPTIVDCDNCGSRIKYDPRENLAALLPGLADTMGDEIYYCPACGPNSPDDYDSVEML